jgi:hypothetical protein
LIERLNLDIVSRLLPRLYVIAFFAGGYSGFISVQVLNIDFLWVLNHYIPGSMAFPAYGILFGMLWMGMGPVAVLFFSGLKDGSAFKSYLMEGGEIYYTEKYVAANMTAKFLEAGVGLVESISLLYASTGGMYLALYLANLYRTGISMEENMKVNFIRRVAISLFLAVTATGLRSIL